MATRSTPSAYVVLLRGINVGGHGKVAMPALRDVCVDIGCADVTTYIQSGNVVLSSQQSAARLETTLAKAIADRLGVSPDVMVRSGQELAAVIENNPYPQAAEGTLHVGFLANPSDNDTRNAVADVECEPEQFTIRDREIYFYLPNGMGRSKLAPLLVRKVKSPVTARNWRTVLKLHAMANTL
ncbi:MAG: DUF1697 domain-containing protein [Nocardioidaceae bacterium]